MVIEWRVSQGVLCEEHDTSSLIDLIDVPVVLF